MQGGYEQYPAKPGPNPKEVGRLLLQRLTQTLAQGQGEMVMQESERERMRSGGLR